MERLTDLKMLIVKKCSSASLKNTIAQKATNLSIIDYDHAFLKSLSESLVLPNVQEYKVSDFMMSNDPMLRKTKIIFPNGNLTKQTSDWLV
jgi:hypothetical protein